MDRSLEPVRDVLERVGAPHRGFNSVLVGGTKGKGSVCALVATALDRAGVAVGIYASPHVERVTERVRLGGEEVGREALAKALEEALEAREAALAEGAPGGAATWFDLVTVAAFLLFAQAEVDWALVEVGIGGRLDSTRALDPAVSVVTNVELEHTATLGPTREAIAGEKAAVVGENGVLVTGVQEEDEAVWEVLRTTCEAAGARLVSVPQRGPIEARNLALAEAVLNELGRLGVRDGDGRPIWRSHLDAEAAASARLPGRQERFSVAGVPVVLDCGHTAEAASLLLEELERDPELGRKPKLLLALGREKDAPRLLKAFAGHVDRCLCSTAPEGRLLDCEELAERAHEAGHDPEAWDDPEEALDDAITEAAETGGWVLIFGSFYLAAVLRPRLERLAADLLD